jgi:hypothetical protein
MIFVNGTNVLFDIIQRVTALDAEANKILFFPEPNSTKICFSFRTGAYGKASIYMNGDGDIGYTLHALDYKDNENYVVTDMPLDAERIYNHLIK